MIKTQNSKLPFRRRRSAAQAESQNHSEKIKTFTMQEIRIDAESKIFGRLATHVASLLRGKDMAQFAPNIFPERKIVISNLKKIRFTGQKSTQKMYYRHSGFTGNIKSEPLGIAFARDPQKVFIKTVLHMLPTNRLRAQIIKNLSFTE